MEKKWKGLSNAEVEKLHTEHGSNTISEKKQPGDLFFIGNQLKSPLIIVLLGAAAITFFLGDIVDTVIILLAVVLNTVLGFIQERKAHKSLLALRSLLTKQTTVLRNGVWEALDADHLVPGDVVRLSSGERIPADGTLLEAVLCFVNESMLTGESVPVEKSAGEPVYSGTILSGGRAVFQVSTIGMHTRLGNIAETLEETIDEETPLQQQLARLARFLSIAVLVLSPLVFIIGLLLGEHVVVMFTTAVAVAVSAIPEGMAVSLTVILAIGMQRILKRKALVRQLVAAETLGSVTTLCVDKTGTLTEGVMRVVAHKLNDRELSIKTASIANNMSDPIEIALWEWVQGQDHRDPQKISESQKRRGEIPFDGARKFMAVATDSDIWVKGAPEVLFKQSRATPKEQAAWMREVDRYAGQGLRVLALAHKKTAFIKHWDRHIDSLDFLGIVGVADPVRPNMALALSACRDAGIAVKMITGDYRFTGEAVFEKLGVPIKEAEREIMEGSELSGISREDLVKRVGSVRLFCRVTPEQKLKIVTILQGNGEVVGMTGDGVNDAMALKKADIGIVVAGASDVARESADIVLLDSNFATIVAAIEEGRVIFHNIQKVVLYLLSDAFTEIFLIIGSLLLSLPLPLTAAQILWINILNDGIPNMALALEPKEGNVMAELPRHKDTSIISFSGKVLIGIVSTLKATLGLIVFVIMYRSTKDVALSQTATFATIAVASFFYVFSIRHFRTNVLRSHPFANPWLIGAIGIGIMMLMGAIYSHTGNTYLGTRPLAGSVWIMVGVSGVILLGFIETLKVVIHKKHLIPRGSII